MQAPARTSSPMPGRPEARGRLGQRVCGDRCHAVVHARLVRAVPLLGPEDSCRPSWHAWRPKMSGGAVQLLSPLGCAPCADTAAANHGPNLQGRIELCVWLLQVDLHLAETADEAWGMLHAKLKELTGSAGTKAVQVSRTQHVRCLLSHAACCPAACQSWPLGWLPSRQWRGCRGPTALVAALAGGDRQGEGEPRRPEEGCAAERPAPPHEVPQAPLPPGGEDFWRLCGHCHPMGG